MAIISIEGRTRPAEVNQAVVAALETWLEQAKAGTLIGVALAGVNNDGTTSTEITQSDRYHHLVSAVTIMQFRLLDESRTLESDD